MKAHTRFMFLLILFAVFMIVFSACSSSGETSATNDEGNGDETYELRMTHVLPEDHASNIALEEWKETLAEESNGQIDLQIYPNGQLYGSDAEAAEAVQLGNIEMTMVGTFTLASFNEKFMVFDLPFLFESREEAHEVMDGKLGKTLFEELPDMGMVGLGYGENGFRQFMNSEHPIESIDDFKGLKTRVVENELYQDTFGALGANASPHAFGELYSALQQGTFDGGDMPISIVASNKFYEVQDYLTMTDQFYAPVVTLINNETFESMPEDLQTLLNETGKEMSQRQRELANEQDTENIEFLKEQGMEINELTSEKKEKLREKLQPIYDKYKDVIGEDLIDLAKPE